MAITLIKSIAGSASSLPTPPIGASADDLVIVVFAGGKRSTGIPDSAADAPSQTSGTGATEATFTLLGANNTEPGRLSFYYRYWTGTDTAVHLGSGYGGNGNHYSLLVLRGVSKASGSIVLGSFAVNTNGNVTEPSVPSGWTEFAYVGGWSSERGGNFNNPTPTGFAIASQSNGNEGSVCTSYDLDRTSAVTNISIGGGGGRDIRSNAVVVNMAPASTTYTRSGTASFTQSASASYVVAKTYSKAPTPPQFTQSASSSYVLARVFSKAPTPPQFTQSASATYDVARVFAEAPTPPQFTQSASVIAESVFVKAETEQFSLFISTSPTAAVSKLNRIVTEDFTFSASTNYSLGTVYPKTPTPPQFTQSASATYDVARVYGKTPTPPQFTQSASVVAESVFVKTETQQFSLFISTSPTATVSKLNRIVSEQFTFSASADYNVGAEYNKTLTPAQFTQSASAIYDVVRVYSETPTPPQFTQSASVDYAAVFIKSETEQFSLFISGNPDATVSKLNRQLSEQFSLSATVDASVSGTFLRSGDGSFTVQIDTPEVSVSFSPTVAPPSFQQSATSVYTIGRTFTRAPATPPQFTQSASVIPDVARVYSPSIDSGVARLEKPSATYTVEYGRTALPPAVETNASAALTYNETATAVFTLKTDLSTSKVDYVKTSTQVFTLSSSSIGGRSVTPSLEAAVFTFPPRTTTSTIVMDRFPEVGASLTVQAPLANFITNAPELLFGINSVVALSTSKVISRTASVSFKLSDGVAAYPYQQVLQVSLNANTDTGTQLPTAVSLNSQITVRREITKIISVSGSAGTNADITGGKIQRNVESTFSFSASTDQASGSNFQVFADIDGIGTVGATLSQRLRTEADIDGVGTIGAPLLQGADIVTITEIWNVALVELGITTVTEVDSSPQAQLLSNVWNGGFRQQFLADHAFHGAKTTRSLSLFLDSSGDPVKPSGNRWSNAYELPTDYIRALTINGLAMQPNNSMGQNAWEIEIVSNGSEPPTLKRCLLSNENSVSLEYIMDIGNDNISLLSPLVAHACGLALAAHVATNFGKNPSEQQQLNQKAQDALLAAKGVDGQESSPRMFSTTSLLDVRR